MIPVWWFRLPQLRAQILSGSRWSGVDSRGVSLIQGDVSCRLLSPRRIPFEVTWWGVWALSVWAAPNTFSELGHCCIAGGGLHCLSHSVVVTYSPLTLARGTRWIHRSIEGVGWCAGKWWRPLCTPGNSWCIRRSPGGGAPETEPGTAGVLQVLSRLSPICVQVVFPLLHMGPTRLMSISPGLKPFQDFPAASHPYTLR